MEHRSMAFPRLVLGSFAARILRPARLAVGLSALGYLALGFLAVAPLASAQDPALQKPAGPPALGYQPAVGSAVRYRVLSTSAGEVTLRLGKGEPHPIRLGMRLEMETRLRFFEVRPDALRVQQEILWLSLTGEVSGRAHAFDSRQPEGEVENADIYAPLYQNLRSLVGRPLHLEVKERGRSLRYRPETLQALDGLGGLLQPEDLLGAMEAVFPPLPKAPELVVGLSEDHLRPVHLASFGLLDLGLRSKIEAVEPEHLVLGLEFRPDLSAAAEAASGAEELTEAKITSSESSGSVRLRRSDGLNAGSRTTLQLQLALREAELEVTGSVRMGSEVTLLAEEKAPEAGR
ncbi:MAG: hypothetical protein JNM84_09685 [Planctomycetes bacterium]|nr:hypothetical protein [Planctomycetota bacterium]